MPRPQNQNRPYQQPQVKDDPPVAESVVEDDPRVARLEKQVLALTEALNNSVGQLEDVTRRFNESQPEEVPSPDEVQFEPLPEGTKRYRATVRELMLTVRAGKKFLVEGEIVAREPITVEFQNGVYTTDDADIQAWIESSPEFTGKPGPRGEPRPRIFEDALAHINAPSVPVSSGVKQAGARPRAESLTAHV